MTTSENSSNAADRTAQEAEELDADGLAALARSLQARRDDLDQFARTAAHDLQAPLRSIEAFARLALEADDPMETVEHLDRVIEAVGRMRRLLDSLLELADSGEPPIERAPIALADVVAAAISDLSRDIEESQAVIEVSSLPSIRADATQLRRVFVNLFSNSIRYAGDRVPRIEVGGSESVDEVTVTVSDHGQGFRSELSEMAFQPLRRLTTEPDGQGIGLAICRRIVERHGGRIWAESTPGEGTRVGFSLPRR